MIVKSFEVRDSMTSIGVLAFKLTARNDRERYLLARAGFGTSDNELSEYVILWRLEGGRCTYDPYDWAGNRTMTFAHEHILKNFDALESGSVVDVEYIFGIRSKTSETGI